MSSLFIFSITLPADQDQFTVFNLKFGKIRRTLTGLSLWFCLHKCFLQELFAIFFLAMEDGACGMQTTAPQLFVCSQTCILQWTEKEAHISRSRILALEGRGEQWGPSGGKLCPSLQFGLFGLCS